MNVLLRKTGIAVLMLFVSMSCFMSSAEGAKQMKNDDPIKTDKEWKGLLTPEQYRILRKKGTERAGSGKFNKHEEKGMYVCAGCGQELFDSDTKYDSGSGWPSYWAPANKDAVSEKSDRGLGMRRTEVLCKSCGGHLGHVFNDGPQPTKLRYCINSAALDFKKEDAAGTKQKLEKATFGAGCFWCSDAAFETLEGVVDVKVGYMGGTKAEADYKKVCSGKTGHAEVSQVTYDPAQVSYSKLLDVFWKIHDPTTLNRQGADVGPQYRSVIFYHSDTQQAEAQASIQKLQEKLEDKIVTEVSDAEVFFEAEGYHQDYYENNKNVPYCRMVIAPKLKKLKK